MIRDQRSLQYDFLCTLLRLTSEAHNDLHERRHGDGTLDGTHAHLPQLLLLRHRHVGHRDLAARLEGRVEEDDDRHHVGKVSSLDDGKSGGRGGTKLVLHNPLSKRKLICEKEKWHYCRSNFGTPWQHTECSQLPCTQLTLRWGTSLHTVYIVTYKLCPQ